MGKNILKSYDQFDISFCLLLKRSQFSLLSGLSVRLSMIFAIKLIKVIIAWFRHTADFCRVECLFLQGLLLAYAWQTRPDLYSMYTQFVSCLEKLGADFYTGNLHKWCFTPRWLFFVSLKNHQYYFYIQMCSKLTNHIILS